MNYTSDYQGLLKDQALLLRFFGGYTTFPEERFIREWVEESEERFRSFMFEKMVFDAVFLYFNKAKLPKEDPLAYVQRKESRITSESPISWIPSWLSGFN